MYLSTSVHVEFEYTQLIMCLHLAVFAFHMWAFLMLLTLGPILLFTSRAEMEVEQTSEKDALLASKFGA